MALSAPKNYNEAFELEILPYEKVWGLVINNLGRTKQGKLVDILC
jgi:hypothetical protein